MSGKEPRWHAWDALAMKRGQHATVYTVDGNEYLGEWADNQRHGKGRFIEKRRGQVYEGEWRFDQRSGYGTLSVFAHAPKQKSKEPLSLERGFSVGKKRAGAPLPARSPPLRKLPPLRKIYAGGWIADKKSGFGTHFQEDGSSYQGEWMADKRSGWGTMHYADGNRYDGEWWDDKRHGQGILHYASGDRYEGMWLQDKREGPGRYLYRSKKQVYEGEWCKDAPRSGYIAELVLPAKAGASASNATHLPEIGLENPNGVLAKERESIMEDRIHRLLKSD